MLGFFADKIVAEVFPNQDVLAAFNRLLFYYFGFDIVIRFFLQQLPVMSIQPYLALPVKKSTLLHFPLVRSVFNFLNLFALLLILPFFFKVVLSTQTPLYSVSWIVSVISFIAFNNFLNFTAKKYFVKKPLLVILWIVALSIFIYLDIAKIISVSSLFSNALGLLSQTALFALLPVVLAVVSYYVAYELLRRNAYIEGVEKQNNAKSTSFQFLSGYGLIGTLIGSELKLIFRNKRPKSSVFLSIFFLLYGIIFYNDLYLNNPYMLAFVGIFLTSNLAMFYYQFAFSWESSFYDTFLVHRISTFNFVLAKYYLFAIMCVLSYLVTLPYAFIDSKIAFINAAMLFYNVGITSIILFFAGSFSTSSIDLGRSQFMNYQGTGAHHFLMMIPLFGIPMIIILLFDFAGMKELGFYGVAILGVVAIMLHKQLVGFISKRLVKRKYIMSSGFRK
ncbi:hypothetical protein CYCD_19760 [Tenuifilaceae bacterium CYCD]|nr:hypothetical protein CYCD_19760 [Tenuifilaceae bacterium CYCD]